MHKSLFIGLIGALVLFAWCDGGMASAKEEREIVRKDGILLVAFGTTVPQGAKAYDGVEAKVRAAFPEAQIQWALTSKTVRTKLIQRGTQAESPESALARMMESGVTHLAVLSLHVSAGQEYHDLVRTVHGFHGMADGFQRIEISRPLLASYEDLERVAKGMLAHAPKKRGGAEGVLLMGHGNSDHPADTVYAAMAYVLRSLEARAFIATVEGRPNLDDALRDVRAQGVKKLYLMPLMTIAGVHARDDMAGDEPDSWKSRLDKKGIASEPVLAGIAEYPEVVEVWLEHLKAAHGRL